MVFDIMYVMTDLQEQDFMNWEMSIIIDMGKK